MFAGALFAFTLVAGRVRDHVLHHRREVTLPIYIYTQIKFGITPAINAVATLLIVSSLTITGLGLLIPRLVRVPVRQRAERRAQRMKAPRRLVPARHECAPSCDDRAHDNERHG